MGIPFKLTFNNSLDLSRKFTDDKYELLKNDEKHLIDFKENQDIVFSFDSEEAYVLHIGIFDSFTSKYFTDEEMKLQESSEKAYVKSNKEERSLFKNKAEKLESPDESVIEYPRLSPGSYMITVTNHKEYYYGLLKISPRHVNNVQLDLMRTEVDKFLLGLSKEYKINMNSEMLPDNSGDTLHYINLFIKYNNEIKNSVLRIINNPASRIDKSYQLRPKTLGGKIDRKSIKYIQKNAHDYGRLLTYNHYSNYNVPPNNTLKYMARFFLEKFNKAIDYLTTSLANLEQEDTEAENYRKSDIHKRELVKQKENITTINQLINIFNKLLTADWMKAVDETFFYKSDTKLVNTTPYNILNSIYLECVNKNEIKDNPLNNYLYYWKDTALLYEIWGFIKVLQAIIELDYTPVQGWVYNYKNIDNQTVLPFLKPETIITFQNNEGITLNVYYDSFILTDDKKQEIENPIFTLEDNRRPDFRIDVYQNKKYLKSIIGDFKYRADYSFAKNYRDNKVYTQLKNYSYARTMFLNANKRKTSSEEAISEAWIIYPGTSYNKVNWDASARIRKIKMSPKKTMNDFHELLGRTIAKIIDK